MRAACGARNALLTTWRSKGPSSTAATGHHHLLTLPPRSFPPLHRSYDLPGNDIRSADGKTAFTKFCVPTSGGYKGKYGWDAYKLACDDTPGCVAAVAPKTPDGCAYLKTKGTRDAMKADGNWVVVTSQEKPAKACTFSPIGWPCTTDVWADQPVCCGGNHVKCTNGKCESTFPSARPPMAPRQYRLVQG
jgi:hypothetical protein